MILSINSPDWTTRKQQRLDAIQSEYFPSPPEGFFKKWFISQPVYKPCAAYKVPQQPIPISLEVNYSQGSSYWMIAIALIIGLLPNVFSEREDDLAVYLGSAAMLLIMVVLPVKQLLYRKPLLIVSEEGLFFTKAGLQINWSQVIAAHIKIVAGESTSYYLIIDYYDAAYDNFEVFCFELGAYDKDYATIAATIAHYQKKSAALG